MSPWNRTRLDVGVGGSVWLMARVVGGVAGSIMIPDTVAAIPVDVDADAPDDGLGGGGSSGMLDACVGAQF